MAPMFQSRIETLQPVMASRGELVLSSPSSVASAYLPDWPAAAKRAIDIVVALIGILLLSVPMLLVGCLIRYESRGSVLFRQTRVGRDGAPFTIWKLRTMHMHAAPQARVCQARRQDPRVTCIGGWLRRTSFNELPQLVNILRGEMSLVGPRPHALGTCAGGVPFEQVTPHYAARHSVRPGLTGLAQVRGWRGETDTAEKLVQRVESDLEYIETWSLRLDLAILLQTVGVVLCRRNAY
jgi:lipopolysaccharide/colanic/teichoic acid biosynthesis glycosyltransferase